MVLFTFYVQKIIIMYDVYWLSHLLHVCKMGFKDKISSVDYGAMCAMTINALALECKFKACKNTIIVVISLTNIEYS